MFPVVIGVAGGTGSGKTTVSRKIIDHLKTDEVVILGLDSYYKNFDLPFEEREKINYDHPDAFDIDLLFEHIQLLKQGQTIQQPVYNYAQHRRMEETVPVKPAKVIIIEGILVLCFEKLRELMDIRIYVDVDADLRFIRRLNRDVKERGRSLSSVVDQYLSVVRVMHLSFVEPSKRHADIIIPRGGHNEIAIDTITTKVRSVLAGEHRPTNSPAVKS